MKTAVISLKAFYFTIAFCLLQAVVFAQEQSTTSTSSKTEVNISTDNGEAWYTSPWVWIVGAAVFILLLVALTSGGRRRPEGGRTDKITVTKTVTRDTDV